MSKTGGHFAFMEMIALFSALCIVGIFFYAFYERDSKLHDLAAADAAKKVGSAIEAYFTENPEATLNAEALTSLVGAQLKPPLKIEPMPGSDKAGDWQVRLYHPEGQLVYLVGKSGITQKHR